MVIPNDSGPKPETIRGKDVRRKQGTNIIDTTGRRKWSTRSRNGRTRFAAWTPARRALIGSPAAGRNIYSAAPTAWWRSERTLAATSRVGKSLRNVPARLRPNLKGKP